MGSLSFRAPYIYGSFWISTHQPQEMWKTLWTKWKTLVRCCGKQKTSPPSSVTKLYVYPTVKMDIVSERKTVLPSAEQITFLCISLTDNHKTTLLDIQTGKIKFQSFLQRTSANLQIKITNFLSFFIRTFTFLFYFYPKITKKSKKFFQNLSIVPFVLYIFH